MWPPDSPRAPIPAIAVPPGLPPVVWADEHMVVIDKPSGLLSVPGKGAAGVDHAWGRVLQHWPAALVVHRLDMGTSGLLIFALHAASQAALAKAFASREIHKTYQALVWGLPALDAGEVSLPLICDWPNRPRQKVDTVRGKPAVTRWSVFQRYPESGRGFARLDLNPVTGRSHQLRVHLLALGHPILGDGLYAPPEAVAASTRLCLHAWRLRLRHPNSGALLALEATVPF